MYPVEIGIRLGYQMVPTINSSRKFEKQEATNMDVYIGFGSIKNSTDTMDEMIAFNKHNQFE